MKNLLNFNAWGTVTVTDNKVTVILVASPEDHKPLSYTLAEEVKRPLDFAGVALVAVALTPQPGYDLVVKEIGETMIMGHPDVDKVFNKAIGALRKTL